MAHIWKIDPRSLDADAELRRLIGKLGAQSAGSNRRNHRRQVAGKLVKVKQEWPPIRQLGIALLDLENIYLFSLGITMIVDREETDLESGESIKWFRLQHTERYQLYEQMFWMYQALQDHDSIMV